MAEITAQTLPAADIGVVLTEMLRTELGRILVDQDTGVSMADEEIDDRIAALDARSARLKRDARRNDYTGVEPQVAAAAAACNIDVEPGLTADLGRRAVDLGRQLLDLESRVADGEDARSLAEPIVAAHATSSIDDFVSAPPVTLSQAWARALELQPKPHMKGNINAIAKVAIAGCGDIPIARLTADAQRDFFVWMARLPKSHGKSHGKNRFCRDAPKDPTKYDKTKDDEIADADRADEATMREIRELDVSDAEKRALLSERLVPRLTMQTLKRNRDGLARMMRAAADLGLKDTPDVISYRDVDRAVSLSAPADPLYIRVTRPKTRMPWSEERLQQLLTSPIYPGCASKHRRWQPGPEIVRDSIYWVPLIVLTIGSRIGEILRLKRTNFVRRNGVDCLSIGNDCDQIGKTAASGRVIPLPQVLLDLGFADWVRTLGDDHGPLLFPDAARRSSIGDVTGPFSKALNRIFGALGLDDFDEDFYAMRKTFSSMLGAADVQEGQRQAIAGHKGGSVLNRHYTAHNSAHLKAAIDSAKFKLRIENSDVHGFPIITDSDLSRRPRLTVGVVLDESGAPSTVQVTDGATQDLVFEFTMQDAETSRRATKQQITEAASKFNRLIETGTLKLPRQPHKRLAVEHFQALGE